MNEDVPKPVRLLDYEEVPSAGYLTPTIRMAGWVSIGWGVLMLLSSAALLLQLRAYQMSWFEAGWVQTFSLLNGTLYVLGGIYALRRSAAALRYWSMAQFIVMAVTVVGLVVYGFRSIRVSGLSNAGFVVGEAGRILRTLMPGIYAVGLLLILRTKPVQDHFRR